MKEFFDPYFHFSLFLGLWERKKKIYAIFRYRKLIHDNSILSNRKKSAGE